MIAKGAKDQSRDYQVLAMQLGDFDEVLDLWKAVEGVGLNESDTRSNIAIYLERNPGMSFIARQGRRLVGAVLCGHDGRRGYLHHLAVARSSRGQGIGKALLNHCLAELARTGILKCNIFVYANHAEGEAFWTHHGWEKRTDLCMMQVLVAPSNNKVSK